MNKVITATPDLADAYKIRGDVYRSMGDNQKALSDFSSAIRLKPLYGEALFSRAELYIGDNKKEEAKTDMTIACKQGYDRACNYQF